MKLLQLIVSSLVLFYLLPWAGAGNSNGTNVHLEFPVFNSTIFSCTGIPSVIAYQYCSFNSSGEVVDVLPPTYNTVYPNQAARMMYTTPITFKSQDGTVVADWSTFFVFNVQHVPTQATLGGGMAFLIAPTLDTPDNSANGGFGLFSMDPATGLPTGGIEPMVLAIEFDTADTPGIDALDVPHVGIDVSSLVSANATVVGMEYVDTSVGMWIDYNNSLQTLKVYCIPVTATDASAASQKPATPLVSISQFSSGTYLNRQGYIGMSAGVVSGAFEDNSIYYWTFKTSGFPPATLLATWYQWWGAQSTPKKIVLIAGAAIGTIIGAYACSECLFFCFCKRIKNPTTPEEERCPVRRRNLLFGSKAQNELPPRRKARDSLSVAKPLNLWTPGSPLQTGAESPDLESASDVQSKDQLEPDSSDEETSLMEKHTDQSPSSEQVEDSVGALSEEVDQISQQVGDSVAALSEEVDQSAQQVEGFVAGLSEPVDQSAQQAEDSTVGPGQANDSTLDEKSLQSKKDKRATEKPLPTEFELQTSLKKKPSKMSTEVKSTSLTERSLSQGGKGLAPVKTQVVPEAEKRPSQGGKAGMQSAKTVPEKEKTLTQVARTPSSAVQSSPTKQRSLQAEKVSPAPPAPTPTSPERQRSLQAEKARTSQAMTPGSPPGQRGTLQATPTGAPQAKSPSSPPGQRGTLQATPTGAPQAKSPSSPPGQRGTFQATPRGAPPATAASSPAQPRPLQTEKVTRASQAPKPTPVPTGATTQRRSLLPEAAVKPSVEVANQRQSQMDSQREKANTPAQQRPLLAGESLKGNPNPAVQQINQPTAKPSLPAQQKPLSVDSQMAKPKAEAKQIDSPKQKPLLVDSQKGKSNPAAQQIDPLKQKPLPVDSQKQKSSPPAQQKSVLPVVDPQTGKPSASAQQVKQSPTDNQKQKPSSPAQQRPPLTDPQAGKPRERPQQTPLSAEKPAQALQKPMLPTEKKLEPRAAKPSSPAPQRPPADGKTVEPPIRPALPAEKKLEGPPQAAKPSSPPKQRALQGEKPGQTGLPKVPPQTVGPPRVSAAALQKSPSQGRGPAPVANTPPSAPRPSPATSPKASSPQPSSQKASPPAPRPSPATSPKATSPQTSPPKAKPKPSPATSPKAASPQTSSPQAIPSRTLPQSPPKKAA